jgi:hypothetical protein
VHCDCSSAPADCITQQAGALGITGYLTITGEADYTEIPGAGA